MDRELALRIVIVRPLAGVVYRVQRGRGELLGPVAESADALVFDLSVRTGSRADGAPNFLGPFAQGRPDDRFVYVSSGTRAGQPGSCWSRRAKVRLAGISAGLVARALDTPGAALQVRIPGAMQDGGPVCASVRPLEGGWSLVTAHDAS
ncbi:MAG TPA: DUF5990 family protein [Longimicrobium sp.]|nr:DUF5990 family protein [Longimicrobium sp.]